MKSSAAIVPFTLPAACIFSTPPSQEDDLGGDQPRRPPSPPRTGLRPEPWTDQLGRHAGRRLPGQQDRQRSGRERTPARASRFASIALALESRPETVPMGQPSCSAASGGSCPPARRGRSGCDTCRAGGSTLGPAIGQVVPMVSGAAAGSGISVTWPSRIRLFALVALAFKAVW